MRKIHIFFCVSWSLEVHGSSKKKKNRSHFQICNLNHTCIYQDYNYQGIFILNGSGGKTGKLIICVTIYLHTEEYNEFMPPLSSMLIALDQVYL
jgi:hypothetical protein